MEVLHGLNHLPNVDRSCAFIERSSFLQDAVEFSSGCVLHDEVDPFFIEEEAVHPHDILMAEVRMDFNLSSQLVNNVFLDQLLLGEGF